MTRKSGILLPVFSLPSRYGIGGFGKTAYRWIDFLKATGQSIWQVLPLGPTSYGDSPYQSFSSFAGNPYFIDPDLLMEEGLLTKAECGGASGAPDTMRYIDYGWLYNTRYALLRKAFARFSGVSSGHCASNEAVLDEFEDTHPWVSDYALFMAYKNNIGGRSWQEWPAGIRLRDSRQLKNATSRLYNEIRFQVFIQMKFFEQWKALKKYASDNGISILGDLPIYLALDSADVWMRMDLFQLDESGHPVEVAGCPPDAFTELGQLWGNPLYRWDLMKEDGYSWWMERLRAAYSLFDCVRIDHFRGFESYYSIPSTETTAINGTWHKGPGMDFINAIHKNFPDSPVIAEDLGFLTDDVRNLLKDSGFPGMKVLLFAFENNPANEYLPHSHFKNTVVYTGTHDNETALGWFKNMPEWCLKYTRDYLGCDKSAAPEKMVDALIRAALSSVSDTAIIPMQDWLALGSEARINEPSTLGGNWTWRMDAEACTPELADRIAYMTWMYGREHRS